MLKILRDKKNAKKIWIGLCAVIIVPFVFWGAGSSVRNREQDKGAVAGVLFGKKVNIGDYEDAVRAVQIQALMQYGDKLEEVQEYLNLEGQAWERLILLHEAKRRRIRIADKEVIAAIQRYPFFNRDGAFSEQTYNHILRYGLRMQPRAFEEQTRQNLMILEVYKRETEGITADEKEVRDQYEKLHEEIGINYIAGLPADFEKEIKTDDNLLKEYYSTNAVFFKKPVSFNVEYVSSESEVTIRQAASSLAQHKDMAKMALEFNLTVKESGPFDENNPAQGMEWPPLITQLFLQMKPGDVSPPFKAKDAYYLARLKERGEANIPAFDDVKDKVKERYLLVEGAKKAQEAVKACHAALTRVAAEGAAVDLPRAAKEHGLRFSSEKPFKYSDTLDGLGQAANLWLAARPLKDAEFSGVISTQSGYYIVQVKERVPVDEKKFEEEKQEFTERVTSYMKQEHFERFLRSLRRQATG